MNHDRLDVLIESLCYMYDYGKDSNVKALELKDMLRSINPSINNDNVSVGLYAMLHSVLEILKELECTDVIDVKEVTLNQSQD